MDKNSSFTKRKDWIDCLRAIAMIFVIYGHQLERGSFTYIYFLFTSPVKIPLFFAISGYLFKEDEVQKTFFRKLCVRLIIPWLALSIIPIFVISLMKGSDYLLSNLISVITGVSAWYMPCCIIAETLFYFVHKKCKSEWSTALFVLFFSILGYALTKHNSLNLLMFNRALFVQQFLYFGYFFHKYEQLFQMPRSSLSLFGVGYILIGIVSALFVPGKSLDIHQGLLYNIPVCLIMIFLGLFLIFSIAKTIRLNNPILCFIGKNTLVYYLWGNYAFSVINAISRKLGFPIGECFLNVFSRALIETVLICCICAVYANLINQFLPEIVGRKR